MHPIICPLRRHDRDFDSGHVRLMYLNVYRLDHVYWSETRLFMALIMGAAMALVMLAFMWGMYGNRRANLAIVAASVIVFAAALFLVRSQRTVEDAAWMKAMIPHHSIAILTSERAEIADPRVRKLADTIIESQTREIAEMKSLLADLGRMQAGRAAPSDRQAGARP